MAPNSSRSQWWSCAKWGLSNDGGKTMMTSRWIPSHKCICKVAWRSFEKAAKNNIEWNAPWSLNFSRILIWVLQLFMLFIRSMNSGSITSNKPPKLLKKPNDHFSSRAKMGIWETFRCAWWISFNNLASKKGLQFIKTKLCASNINAGHLNLFKC